MNKLSRQQTAAEVLRIISKLPSKELISNRFWAVGLQGVKPGDCRFCVKGAVMVFTGAMVLRRIDGELVREFGIGDNHKVDLMDYGVLDAIEESLFLASDLITEQTVAGRKKLFKVAVAKCKEIMAA